MSLEAQWDMLYAITMSLVRADKESVLQWFARIVEVNQDRGKMHVRDEKSVGSDGFMVNCLAVLLKICDPLMDPSYSKLSLISL